MYTSFRVSGFRCFEDLSIEGLERVNLIAGKNGVGKTALLEALFLNCGANNPSLVFKLRSFRGLGDKVGTELRHGGATPWDSLFREADAAAAIDLDGRDGGNGRWRHRFVTINDVSELQGVPGLADYVPGGATESSVPLPRVLRLDYEYQGQSGKRYLILEQKGMRVEPVAPPAPFPAQFLHSRRPVAMTELAQRFAKAEKAGQQQELVGVLQILEPRLRRVTTLAVEEPVLYGEIGAGTLVSLPEMGDGLVRLAELALAMRENRDGVLLVDEIENGIHYSARETVWKAVAEAARKFNVQVFATTHSWECITAAHRAFSESETYDFKLHRLERIKGMIKAVSYEQDTLQAAIEMGMEVR